MIGFHTAPPGVTLKNFFSLSRGERVSRSAGTSEGPFVAAVSSPPASVFASGGTIAEIAGPIKNVARITEYAAAALSVHSRHNFLKLEFTPGQGW